MRAVGCAEGVAHEDITELSEAGTEGGDFFGIGFGGGAVFVFDFAFFFNVEAEIFEQDDFSGMERGAGGFDFGADAIVEELHGLAEEFGEFFSDGLERKFFDDFAIRAAEVAHENDGCAFIQGVLDRGQCGGDALGVRNGAGLFVLGNIEVDAHENAFAVYGNVFDGFFHSW
jgi:hypothetical protein